MEDQSIVKIKKILSTYNSPKRENKKNVKEYKDNIILSNIPITHNSKEEYSSEDLNNNSIEEYNNYNKTMNNINSIINNNINIYLDKIIDNLSEIRKISIKDSKIFLDKIECIRYKIKRKEERKSSKIAPIAFFIAAVGVLISFYYFK